MRIFISNVRPESDNAPLPLPDMGYEVNYPNAHETKSITTNELLQVANSDNEPLPLPTMSFEQ